MRLQDSEFYVLRKAGSIRCLCTDAPGVIREKELALCPLDPGHARIGRFLSDLDLVIPCAPPADVLFTWGGECLVQEGVLTAMEHARLTGFWIRPAKARMKKTGEPVPIRQLHVSGWGGVAPPESGIRRVKYCAGCQSSHYSDITNPEHLIDSRNWDGSDFFKIWPLLGFVFVTERVQQIFKVNGFKGARFLKTFPTGAVTAAHGLGYGPPPLRWTFPDDRAHEIGDPLGIY